VAEWGAEFELFGFLEEQVEGVLRELEGGRKPIVRIKVEVTGLAENVQARHLEARFLDRVANGEKILQLWRRKAESRPQKMDDDELLSRLKTKQPLRNNSGIAEELDAAFRKHYEKVATSVLPKEGLMEIVSYLGRTETPDAAAIIRKKCL
jgi:uncharacterized protein with von Willebrand factor type A (vWA) domain